VDEEEARQTLELLAELEELAAEQGEPPIYTLQ